MANDINPFESPGVVDEPLVEAGPRNIRDRFSLVGWPVVYSLNVILPLMLAWGLTEQHGRYGMFLAMLLVLSGGWYVAARWTPLARRVIVGALPVALSQFFPILHIYLGMASIMLVGMATGNNVYSGSGGPPIASEPAGFAVTMLVGGGLLLCSAVIGGLLSLVVARRWFSATGGQ